jgi:hypothetical protein
VPSETHQATPDRAGPGQPRRGRPPLTGSGRSTRGPPRAGRGLSRGGGVSRGPSVRAASEEPPFAPLKVSDYSVSTPPGGYTSLEHGEPQDGAEASPVARELEVVQKSDGTQGLKITLRPVSSNSREHKD